MKDLEGKTAFITGGSSGIGLGIARALHAAGMNVAIAARRRDQLDAAMQWFSAAPAAAHALQLDVTDRAAMARAVEEVVAVFGKVHVLCNNAGAGVAVPIPQATFNDWDWAMSLNVGGVINGVQIVLPKILAHGEGGHIVTTSSMSGLCIGGSAGIYSTTKYAVVGMMESLRADLQDRNVGVSVFCPGVVDTNFHESEEGRPACYAETGRMWPADLRSRIKEEFMSKGMAALEAGERVLQGIRRNDLYILSHREYEGGVRARFEALLASMPVDDEPPPAQRIEIENSLSLLTHPVYTQELQRLQAEGAPRFDPRGPALPRTGSSPAQVSTL